MNEKEDLFLEHLRTELSLHSSEEAKPLVKSVLHALRRTLTRQNADALLDKLPEFLRKYFTDGAGEEQRVNVEHLDELVVLVMEEDRQKEKTLFKSEIQTLSVILFTFRRIFSRLDPKTFGISQLFSREVREASVEMV